MNKTLKQTVTQEKTDSILLRSLIFHRQTPIYPSKTHDLKHFRKTSILTRTHRSPKQIARRGLLRLQKTNPKIPLTAD